LLPINIFIDK
jgi:phospholipid-transporting ATPase